MPFKTSRLIAVAAIAAIPVVVVSTSSAADQYTPYTPYTPATTPVAPSTTPVATTPAASTPVVPVVVLNAVETAIKKSIKNVQFADLLNGGKSETLTIPIPGVGTYTVTVLYRLPGKKYKSIAKGAVTVKTPGATAKVPLKPNANGKKIYKVLKANGKKVIKIHVTISYEVNGKTISTTISKNIDKS